VSDINRFQGFLNSNLKLDTILDTTIGSDGGVPTVKDFSKCESLTNSHQLPSSNGQYKLPLNVLHLNVQCLQSAHKEFKFLVALSPREVVTVFKIFFFWTGHTRYRHYELFFTLLGKSVRKVA